MPVADLTSDDFEIVDSGAPQKIEQFERVVIRGSVPQDLRREPGSVEEARQAAQDPRARVFVVFLDTGHVDVGGSHNIRQPLVDALNTLIGADDLVAVMTPQMSAADLAFARRTTTIEGMLARYWTWGQRDRLVLDDPTETQYEYCYGPYSQNAITREMVDRRREKMTLDALEDLVVSLRGLREERKAVIAITNGWVIFGPNPSLARMMDDRVPSAPPPGVDPRTGRLSGRGNQNTVESTQNACDRDRLMLSQIDDVVRFRQLPDLANRANVSFYPIDPRGLPVFDSPITNPLPLAADAQVLRTRVDTLRVLADNTDGIAGVNSNDLARSFRRIVDDLSSYYLLGYYSTAKLDGKFHAITVRVKRPGVQVRARRGYLAATPAAMTAAARAGAAPPPDPAAAAKRAEAHAIDAVLAPLALYARDVPLRLQVAAGWPAGAAAAPSIWLVGEIGAAGLDAWADGFEVTATLTDGGDTTVASGRAAVARGGRTFRIALTPQAPIGAGELMLRVSARAGASAVPSRESARVTIAAAPEPTGALWVRRGPATANKEVPTADLRFRRSEQLRVEIPAASGDQPTARLLDRAGNPLNVPVAAARRDEADGSRWLTASLALAPLAPGDYVVEIASGERRSIAAFRVIP